MKNLGSYHEGGLPSAVLYAAAPQAFIWAIVRNIVHQQTGKKGPHMFYEIYNVSGELLGAKRYQLVTVVAYGVQVLVTMMFVYQNHSL